MSVAKLSADDMPLEVKASVLEFDDCRSEFSFAYTLKPPYNGMVVLNFKNGKYVEKAGWLDFNPASAEGLGILADVNRKVRAIEAMLAKLPELTG